MARAMLITSGSLPPAESGREQVRGLSLLVEKLLLQGLLISSGTGRDCQPI